MLDNAASHVRPVSNGKCSVGAIWKAFVEATRLEGTGKGWKPDRSGVSVGTPPALLAEVERFPIARDTTCSRIPCHVNPHLRGRLARAGTGLSSRRWQGRTWAGRGEKVGTPWEAA